MPKHIPYSVAKTSFGMYLVTELRLQGGKEYPTETDVKKILQRINPRCTPAELQTARQISRYCQTSKDYLKDAREETLDKVAKAMNAPIKTFADFREKINPLLKAFKYYSHYVGQAEEYVRNIGGPIQGGNKKRFCGVFACNDQSKVYLSLISYHFGAVDKELPAISFGAESDLRTERTIRDLFDGFDLPAPQYLPENTFFEQVGQQPTKTTFIAIGLFGKRLTGWMGNSSSLGPALKILPAEKCIQLGGTGYFANRSQGIDYALFCKVALNHNSTVCILGGIEGFGTQRLGEYLEENWPLVHGLVAGKNNAILLYKTDNETMMLEKLVYN